MNGPRKGAYYVTSRNQAIDGVSWVVEYCEVIIWLVNGDPADRQISFGSKFAGRTVTLTASEEIEHALHGGRSCSRVLSCFEPTS